MIYQKKKKKIWVLSSFVRQRYMRTTLKRKEKKINTMKMAEIGPEKKIKNKVGILQE